jgi:aspartate kinase
LSIRSLDIYHSTYHIQIMALYILKFGGTSVANLARLEHAAQVIRQEILNGNQVVAVVSAMAGITDQLVGYSKALCPHEATPEHDVVASAGEQVTAGLLALALKKAGMKARSFLSWQIPIHTDSVATNARIQHINPDKILQSLSSGEIPVVSGFQGLSKEGMITTIGRGGSDTTAVAMAVALKADRCDIYTDVDGVYTADPQLVPEARRQDTLSYSEMFEMAAAGAKVLQARSVEMAMKHGVRLRVLSSLTDSPKGTEIIEDKYAVEKENITGIVHSLQEAKVTLKNLKDQPGIAAKLYTTMGQSDILIDMVTQSHTREGCCDMDGMISRNDIERFSETMNNFKESLGFSDISIDKNVAKITVIGIGLRSNMDIPALICRTLADEGINIHMIYSSEIKMSLVINQQSLQAALTALHKVFCLDQSSSQKAA